MMRRASGYAVVVLVLAAACGSSDRADATPTAGVAGPATQDPSAATTPSATTDTPLEGDTTETPLEGETTETPLEGEWYESSGAKTLVVRGDIAEFYFSQGPFSIDTDADPDQITLPFENGELTTIFRLDGGRLDLVFLAPPTPLPESIEAAAGDPELYNIIELFRANVVFASGVWTPAGHGLPPRFNVQDMTVSGDSLIVGSISADQGLFISTDNGASWRQVGGGFPAGESVWALATVGGRVFAGTQGRGVFVSDDGGETWTDSNEGLASPDADCPGDPGSPHSQIGDIAGFGSTVFVASFCGVSRSDDLGETWREIDEGFMESPNVGISLAVGDGLAYLSSQQHGVFRLDWEKDRWETISQAVGFATALAESEGAVFLSSPSSGVWRSDDFGENWTDVTAPRFNGVLDLAVADLGIFAATPDGVFWTDDKGETWVAYNKDLVLLVSALEVSGGRLFAAARSAGVFSAPLPDQFTPPAPSTVIPVEAPEGYQVFDGSREGFAIALPAGWVAIDMTVGDRDSIAVELEKIFPPEDAKMLSSNYVQSRKTATSGSAGLVMVAFDVTGESNFTVWVFPRASLGTLESEEDILRTFSGGIVQSIERLEVSGRDAWRLARLFLFEGGESEFIEYIVLGENIIYKISPSSSQPEAVDELASLIIDTFTIADD